MEHQDIQRIAAKYDLSIATVEQIQKSILRMYTTNSRALHKTTIESWICQTIERKQALERTRSEN